jgi:membrane-bound ClpP family serine protease
MNGRLVIAIISTIAEEAAILIIGIWLLPMVGIKIPALLIVGIMAIWFGWSVFTYRKGTWALGHKPVKGLVNMIDMNGIVVKSLQPDGLVKIHGELWKGSSISGSIEVGTEVTVVRQEGLKLLVRPNSQPVIVSPVDKGNNNQDNTDRP